MGEGGGNGGGAKSRDGEKAWSFINHSIFSDTLFSMITYSEVFALGEPTFQYRFPYIFGSVE